MELIIAHVYPELLNLYGDSGNLLTLKARLNKRNIDVKIVEYSLNDSINFSSTLDERSIASSIVSGLYPPAIVI